MSHFYSATRYIELARLKIRLVVVLIRSQQVKQRRLVVLKPYLASFPFC